MTTLRPVLGLLILSLALLVAGCQSQPDSAQYQAGAKTPPVPSPQPTRAESLPTSQSQTQDITPVAKGEQATPLPTALPLRSVDWLVELLLSSQAITITALDAPEIQTQVDEDSRQRLVDAVRGHTTATNVSDDWLALYLPYPNYSLTIDAASQQTTISWAGTQRFRVNWSAEESYYFDAYYVQDGSTLWRALEEIAPAPHSGPESVRHLLHANALTSRWDGHEYTYEPAVILRIARSLAFGSPASIPPPEQEPGVLFSFTVEGKDYEVTVWENEFTYNGRTYRLENALQKMTSVLSWGTEKK